MERPIDALVHHDWRSQLDVMEYMSRGWQEYLGQPLVLPEGGPTTIPVLPMQPYSRPDGDKLPGSAPADGPPGSSYELMKEQLLDRLDVECAILGFDDALMQAPVNVNTHLAKEFARAANDWTIDRWLERDPRLAALILVPTQTPEAAAEEIARIGTDARMVGVLLGTNGLNKPLGHPVYHPIYRAAAELDLPLVIHAGTDVAPDILTSPTAGGLASTYAENAILRPQSMMTHVATLIGQGVFVKYPNLRVLAAGAGVAWLPSLVWRFDNEYVAYRREAPWLKEMPRDVVRRHVRVSTYPLDHTPEPEHLHRLMDAYGDMEDLVIYASGYPNWDADFPEAIEDRIRPEARARVFHDNARDFFRWSPPANPIAVPETLVGSMDQPVTARHSLD